MIKKTASAHWEGDVKNGIGSISTQTGVLKNAPYGFKARFEDGPGTNPEELIGAAHAGCFSMALSMILGNAGMVPKSIDTKATISLDKDGDGFAVKSSHLDVVVEIPGADQQKFDEAAAAAKAGCPISKLLNAEITMTATLKN
ncbi:OsmC family protein [Robbsia sp. Bb-Pol-6]|uniref:OsmC family protein n=1 Tax=Robbsia betulipollinis TaxID=2981849 RepID=A0ABT3ZHE6_9BURK|nr:OsmC family protein [Robbsia betulipollinis]MCY0385755.1 OsmC family protein [Robbsia betulipollinis]